MVRLRMGSDLIGVKSEIRGGDPKYRASDSSACYKGEHSGIETKQALVEHRC
jgi:hypothetical protein